MEAFNLDISTYSLDDLYNLFHISPEQELTEDMMKQMKKLVLQTHPDKSRLDSKFFLFFSKAYKRLYEIYVRVYYNQTNINCANRDCDDTNINFSKSTASTLSRFFERNPELRKNPHKFNEWFNREFLQCSEPLYKQGDDGYGEWFSMTAETNNDLALTDTYNRVSQYDQEPKFSLTASSLSVSIDTDLKEAYTTTILPTDQTIFDSEIAKHQKAGTTVQARQFYRDAVSKKTRPLDKSASMHLLNIRNQEDRQEYVKSTYNDIQRAHQIASKQEQFIGRMRLLTDYPQQSYHK